MRIWEHKWVPNNLLSCHDGMTVGSREEQLYGTSVRTQEGGKPLGKAVFFRILVS